VDIYSILGVLFGLSLAWGWLRLPGFGQVASLLVAAGVPVMAGIGFWLLTPFGLSPLVAAALGATTWLSACAFYAARPRFHVPRPG
jgi:hypothetical protein